MNYNRLDREGNVGHSSSMTRGNRGRRKSQMIGQTLKRQNDTFSSEEIWKRLFSFEDRSWRIKTSIYSQKLQEVPVKSKEQNLWTAVSRKADSADSGGMSLVRKRKEPEK